MAKQIEIRGDRRLTSAQASFLRPTWSTDGRLAMEADGMPRSIYIIDGKGRIECRLTDGAEPTWSPDCKRLAFTRPGSDGRREIWLVDRAKVEVRRLAGGDGGVWEHPAWSPDGKQIACASDFGNPGGLRHIWLLDAEQGDRRRLTCDPQRSDGHPAWSPDGGTLAFDADDRADEAREIDAYVLDMRSGALVCLSDGAAPIRRPVFVDRRYLVAERRSVNGPALVVLDRGKKRTMPIGHGPGGQREPAISVDGGKHPRVLVAYARRSQESGRDAVWVGELGGLKIITEAQWRKHEEEEARRQAAAQGLPVLPALPPPAPSTLSSELADPPESDEAD